MKENDVKKTIKNIYFKNKSIHDYFINLKNPNLKNNETKKKLVNINESNNIYIKYLKNSNIIFRDKGDNNNKNLKLLFDELNEDMDKQNNIIFPFLNVLPNLVQAYIDSDLDDTFTNKTSDNISYYLITNNKNTNNIAKIGIIIYAIPFSFGIFILIIKSIAIIIVATI